MIARVALTLIVAVAVFLAGGLLLPRSVQVERSIVVERPPATVHGLVDGFATFSEWSPWMERDPDMSYTVSEPAFGQGAWFEWDGDPRQVGGGRQEVVASTPHRSVEVKVDHDQLGRALMRFEIERIAQGARLTWRYESDLVQGRGFPGGVLSRYFGLFFEPWIGRDLARSLGQLKALAESLPAADFAGLRVERVDTVASDIVYLTANAGIDDELATDNLAAAWRELFAFVAGQGLERTGQPLAITHFRSDGWRVDAALPVRAAGMEPSPPIRFGRSPSGPAVRVVHRGPYAEVAGVYEKLAAWMAVRGLREAGVSWERYLSDPALVVPEQRETLVYVLLED